MESAPKETDPTPRLDERQPSDADAASSSSRPQWAVGITGLVLAVMLLPFFGLQGSVGVFVGALLSVLNLHVLTRSVKGFLNAGEPGAWAVVAIAKLAAFGGLIYFLLSSRLVEGLPLVIGMGALPIGVVVCQLTATRHPESSVPSRPSPSRSSGRSS